MISLLQSSPTVSIGAMLGTDFNQSLHINPKDGAQELLAGLKSAGYVKVIGMLPSDIDSPKDIMVSTTSMVKTVPLYSIEKDLTFLLGSGEASTLGKKYLLIEADKQATSSDLEDAVLELRGRGYTPVLIQAEGYEYLQDNYRNIKRLQDRGCLLQADILSLTGALGIAAKRLAKRLIYGGFASFIGSGITNLDEQRRSEPLLHSRKLAKLLQTANIKNRELVF